MRTRSALPIALALALVACKSEAKKADPASDLAVRPNAALDAAPSIKPAASIDAASVAAPDDTLKKPFFYKVTSKDGKSIHMLGSVHMGVDPKRLPKAVWDAEQQAKTFAMETDASNPMAAAQALARTDGTTLEDELGPDYWKKLEDAIGNEVPGGAKMLNMAKAAGPAMVVELIGMPRTEPIDSTLLADAKAHNENIVYLEPFELQLKVLLKWFDTRMLKYELDHLDDIKQKHTELIDAYVAGDEAAMDVLDEDTDAELAAAGLSPDEVKQMEDDLLYSRNAAWIEPIEKMLAEGNAFVVVGAAHLMGERSVLDLLRQKGYTVERITP